MKDRAKKHLEIALGGNMNISTLKPLAFEEIMIDFAKAELLRELEIIKDAFNKSRDRKSFEVIESRIQWNKYE